MGDRTYHEYYVRYANELGFLQVKEQVKRTEQKRKLFGGYQSVEVTKEEKIERPIPFLLYTEDGITREFFTGEEIRFLSSKMWISDDRIPDDQRKNWSISISSYASRANYYTLNATQFAEQVQKWMPYKAEVTKRIYAYKNELADKYLKTKAAAETAQRKAAIKEQESEDWLDSMIKGSQKGGKF